MKSNFCLKRFLIGNKFLAALGCVALLTFSCQEKPDDGPDDVVPEPTYEGGGTQSGLYLGVIGFNQDLYTWPVKQINSGIQTAFNSFVDGVATKDGALLYYSVDHALNTLQNIPLPEDLAHAAVITFTGSLDQGSLEKNRSYSTDDAYMAALNRRLKGERVKGQPILAYAFGVPGEGIKDASRFEDNLVCLGPSGHYEIKSVDALVEPAQGIVDQLKEKCFFQKVTLSVPEICDGKQVRLSFDDAASANASGVYIEGRFDKAQGILTEVRYRGMSSSSGATVQGTPNGSSVSFTFEGLRRDDARRVSMYYSNLWYNTGSEWLSPEKFVQDRDVVVDDQRLSSVVLLVVDCSSSMGSSFAMLQQHEKYLGAKLFEVLSVKKTVEAVRLSDTSLSLVEGESARLTATVLPSDAEVKTVVWSSSDSSVATVSSDGEVVAVKAGTAVITVTTVDGGYSAKCTVTVKEKTVAVTSVTLSQTSLALEEGQTATLTATVSPADATDKTVTWSSSNPSVATVTEGRVSAVKEGTATITASCGGKSATCSVTVSRKYIAVTSVTLNQTSLSLEEGDSATLIATVSPADATEQTISWSSSNPSVATVAEGRVSAVKEGTATITASCGGKSASCTVSVKKKYVDVTSVTLSEYSMTMEEGQTATLIATVNPANATEQTVKWSSSNPSVATVTEGRVTAIKEGTASITASCGGKSASCSVTVKKSIVAVVSVTLSQTALTLEEGQTATLTATVSPADATDQTVTWSSTNQAVATVADGKVTAVGEGMAIILASCGGKSASCSVTVNKKYIDVTSVTLSKTSLSLVEGQTAQLVATVSPADATEQTVKWSSSNASVASVVEGKVTAVKEGTATITASCGGKSAACAVTVSKKTVEVTSIVLNRTTLSLNEGESATLVATVFPSDATDQNVVWSTSNESVATVVEGKVTAVKEGTATITASCGGKSATCSVTVKKKNVPVTSLTLSETSLTLIEGDTAVLTVTINPSDATDQNVTWSSSNSSVASVEGGKVTALKKGTATITASCGGKMATCTVTVKGSNTELIDDNGEDVDW